MTASQSRRPAWIRLPTSTVIISSRAWRTMRWCAAADASSRIRRRKTGARVFVRSPHAHARIRSIDIVARARRVASSR